MAWTILSTEQASFETDKGSFYYVKAYVNESLSAGESYSNPNIPSSVFSGKDVSFFASDYGFTPFVSIDGNVKAIHDTNRDAYYLQFYENGTMFSEERVGGAGSFIYNYGFVCWCMLIDPDGNGILQPSPVYLSSSNMQRISYNTADSFGVVHINRDWYTSGTVTISATQNKQAATILNAVPVLYNWKGWTILQGNSGQYRQRLTAIKDESIGDISTANYGTQNNFIFIAPNVDMVPYARNMNYNSPVKVAWSGINWMTMELQSEQGLLTNQVKAVFKLYAATSSDTTPIYQETRYFFVGSTNHFYLSFVHDDEQMAGAFLPVYYTAGQTATPFSWGNAAPSESDMLLIWQWLQASGSPEPDPQP